MEKATMHDALDGVKDDVAMTPKTTRALAEDVAKEAVANMAKITTGHGLRMEEGPDEQMICIDKEMLVQLIRDELGKRSD